MSGAKSVKIKRTRSDIYQRCREIPTVSTYSSSFPRKVISCLQVNSKVKEIKVFLGSLAEQSLPKNTVRDTAAACLLLPVYYFYQLL